MANRTRNNILTTVSRFAHKLRDGVVRRCTSSLAQLMRDWSTTRRGEAFRVWSSDARSRLAADSLTANPAQRAQTYPTR